MRPTPVRQTPIPTDSMIISKYLKLPALTPSSRTPTATVFATEGLMSVVFVLPERILTGTPFSACPIQRVNPVLRTLTSTAFPLHGYRYYHGSRIVNEARTAEHRLAGIRSGKFALLDPETEGNVDSATLEAEFPGGSWFEVYDYGVGDTVEWTSVVSVSRGE